MIDICIDRAAAMAGVAVQCLNLWQQQYLCSIGSKPATRVACCRAAKKGGGAVFTCHCFQLFTGLIVLQRNGALGLLRLNQG